MELPESLKRLFGTQRNGETIRVKLGSGVIGNTTYGICAISSAVAFAAWALSDHPLYAILVVICIFVLGLVYLCGSWIYGHHHPEEAVLGGAEYLGLQGMKFGAKGIGEIPTIQPIEAPTSELRPIPGVKNGE